VAKGEVKTVNQQMSRIFILPEVSDNANRRILFILSLKELQLD